MEKKIFAVVPHAYAVEAYWISYIVQVGSSSTFTSFTRILDLKVSFEVLIFMVQTSSLDNLNTRKHFLKSDYVSLHSLIAWAQLCYRALTRERKSRHCQTPHKQYTSLSAPERLSGWWQTAHNWWCCRTSVSDPMSQFWSSRQTSASHQGFNCPLIYVSLNLTLVGVQVSVGFQPFLKVTAHCLRHCDIAIHRPTARLGGLTLVAFHLILALVTTAWISNFSSSNCHATSATAGGHLN